LKYFSPNFQIFIRISPSEDLTVEED